MGGHALSKESIRLSNNDFWNLTYKINSTLLLYFDNIHFVRPCLSKESHGDMDILVFRKSNDYSDIYEFINNNFSNPEIKTNSDCVSFGYIINGDTFQIDLIKTYDYFDSAITFYDFDPVGNLVGKLTHKLNLKFGFKGLVFPFRNNVIIKNITLSTNIHEIFNFLDLDYIEYSKGFVCEEEIFKWIIQSKYFNSKWYKYENMNSRDIHRNKRRSSYQNFIKYVSDIPEKKDEKYTYDETIDLINDNFPNIKINDIIEALENKVIINKLINECKFSGKIILEKYPDLNKKKLGELIKSFKKLHPDWINYMVNTPKDDIMFDFSKLLYY